MNRKQTMPRRMEQEAKRRLQEPERQDARKQGDLQHRTRYLCQCTVLLLCTLLSHGIRVSAADTEVRAVFVNSEPTLSDLATQYLTLSDLATPQPTLSESVKPRFTKPARAASGQTAASESDVPIDSRHFPDAAFRTYIHDKRFDIDGDGILSCWEAFGITALDCKGRAIKSLEGIQYFNNLDTLDCSKNQLKELDLAENFRLNSVNCAYNTLTALRLPMWLGTLDCSHNQLTELDLSRCPCLVTLDCSYNDLKKLNVSACLYLGELSVDEHDAVVDTTLNCSHNQLTSIDLNSNRRLASLDCSYNQLSSLNTSACKDLAGKNGYLRCNHNQIKTLTYSPNSSIGMFTYDARVTLRPVLADTAYNKSSGRTSAKKLEYGKSVTLSFTKQGQTAWYKFTTKAKDGYYGIALNCLKQLAKGDGSLAVSVYIFKNGEMNAVKKTDTLFNKANVETIKKLNNSKMFYVKLVNRNAKKVTLTLNYYRDKYPETSDEAVAIKRDTTYRDTLATGLDLDWLSFKAPLSGAYILSLQGNEAGLDLYDSDGRTCVTYTQGNKTIKLVKGKTYLIRAHYEKSIYQWYDHENAAYTFRIVKK